MLHIGLPVAGPVYRNTTETFAWAAFVALGFLLKFLGISKPLNVLIGLIMIAAAGIAIYMGTQETAKVSYLDRTGVITQATITDCNRQDGCYFTYDVKGVTYQGGPDTELGIYHEFPVKYLPSDPNVVLPTKLLSYTFGYALIGLGSVFCILGLVVACFVGVRNPASDAQGD